MVCEYVGSMQDGEQEVHNQKGFRRAGDENYGWEINNTTMIAHQPRKRETNMGCMQERATKQNIPTTKHQVIPQSSNATVQGTQNSWARSDSVHDPDPIRHQA